MPGSRRRLHDEEGEAPVEAPSTSAPVGHRPLRGTLLLLASMLIVPFMDASAKYLTMNGHNPLQVAWLRMAMQSTIVIPIAAWRHGVCGVLRAPRPHLLLLRGCFLVGATIFFFTAIGYMPLADAIAITFIEPIILLILSAAFLRERVPLRRWIVAAIGFGAVMLIVKPGGSSFHPASLSAMLASVFFSMYLLSTRAIQLGPNPPPTLVMLGYQSVPGAIALGLALPATWSPITSNVQLALALSMGAIGATSHALLILAFQACEASFLAPLLYSEIIMQTVLGYAIWGDIPDALTIVGIVIIISAGLYLGSTESRAQKRPSEQGEAPAPAAPVDASCEMPCASPDAQHEAQTCGARLEGGEADSETRES